MTWLSGDVENRLLKAFAENNLALTVRTDCLTSCYAGTDTREKIRQVIRSIGLCPVISENMFEGNVVFTIVPCRLPKIQKSLLVQRALTDKVISSYRAITAFMEENEADNVEGYAAHFTHNKKNILSLSANLSGEALILGLGKGSDIPLYELVHQFDQITVLDIDTEAMQSAIQKLPANLQHKIIPIQKDLTGILSLISEQIEQMEGNSSDCLTQTALIIEKSLTSLKNSLLTSVKKYNFVVSSMLTSQLFSQIATYILDALEKKYPGFRNTDINYAEFNHALLHLKSHVCRTHLQNLSDWTDPNGKIYYADTTHINLIDAKFFKDPNSPRILTFLKTIHVTEACPNDLLNNAITELFKVLIEKDSWKWETLCVVIREEPVLQCVRRGNVANVAAHFLQPKTIG